MGRTGRNLKKNCQVLLNDASSIGRLIHLPASICFHSAASVDSHLPDHVRYQIGNIRSAAGQRENNGMGLLASGGYLSGYQSYPSNINSTESQVQVSRNDDDRI